MNILVLAIVTRRFRVPLMWRFIDHSGNSDTAQCIALIQRYLNLFGASSIKALLADRGFVGTEWIKFLIENNVPFAIRLKEDMQLRLEDGILREFRSLLRKHKSGSWQSWLKGMEPTSENRLHGKTHGRREKSWFCTGFDALRKWIIYQPMKALQAWMQNCPKTTMKMRTSQ